MSALKLLKVGTGTGGYVHVYLNCRDSGPGIYPDILGLGCNLATHIHHSDQIKIH